MKDKLKIKRKTKKKTGITLHDCLEKSLINC